MRLTPPAPAARQRRRPLLTREEIVEAAARVLEREGYEALTMRRLAEELGVQAPALYWHVRGRDELEGLLLDHLVADLDLAPTGADWRDDLRRIAAQWRHFLRGKREITRLAQYLNTYGPNLLRHMEVVLGVLRRAGLSDRDAAYAWGSGVDYVFNFAGAEAALRMPVADTGMTCDEMLAEVSRTFAALPAETYPNVVALAADLTTVHDVDARFEFGVECLIAGIERRIGGAGKV